MSINRTPNEFRSDSGGGYVRENGIFMGIIKDNKDVQRMGRLKVFIPEFGGDPRDPESWYTVSYASPFAGATPVENNKQGGKKMADTQKSYGLWMTPPDLENYVLVCFVNGDPARGFWFACVWQQFMNHMVPGIPINISTDDEINKLNLPPVCEYNKQDTEGEDAAAKDPWNPKRPVFEPLHNGLSEQGLYTDPERGPGTSGARRESPSKVYGLLSPNGHTIHIDEDQENEFVRIRTRSGVQILVHETTGYIYMNSKKGNSWFEISDEGIDMYSKRSISMRAEENINIHADQSIVLHGAGAVHTHGANVTTRSTGRISQKADGEVARNSPRIKDNSTPEYQKEADESAKDNQNKSTEGTGAGAPGSNNSGMPATDAMGNPLGGGNEGTPGNNGGSAGPGSADSGTTSSDAPSSPPPTSNMPEYDALGNPTGYGSQGESGPTDAPVSSNQPDPSPTPEYDASGNPTGYSGTAGATAPSGDTDGGPGSTGAPVPQPDPTPSTPSLPAYDSMGNPMGYTTGDANNASGGTTDKTLAANTADVGGDDADYIANATPVASWRMPTDYGRITDVPGSARDGGSRSHAGYDIGRNGDAIAGAPVYAVSDGVVTRVVRSPDGDAGGLRVYVQHEDGSTSRYMHLGSVSDLRVGQSVEGGAVLGSVGGSGSSGMSNYVPHLHYERRDSSGRVTSPLGDDSLSDNFKLGSRWNNRGDSTNTASAGTNTGSDGSTNDQDKKKGTQTGNTDTDSSNKNLAKGGPQDGSEKKDIKGTVNNYQETKTRSTATRLPTHEPWEGHPRSKEGPRQGVQTQGSGGGKGSSSTGSGKGGSVGGFNGGGTGSQSGGSSGSLSGGGTRATGAKNISPEDASAIVDSANRLGISPKDLATVISYETGGSFRTDKYGGKGGRYMGLIQFGPNEQKTYGAYPNQTIPEQLVAVEGYLKDRGLKPGMGIDKLYATINGGNPNVSLNASDGNGTIRQHIDRMQAQHGGNADLILKKADEFKNGKKPKTGEPEHPPSGGQGEGGGSTGSSSSSGSTGSSATGGSTPSVSGTSGGFSTTNTGRAGGPV